MNRPQLNGYRPHQSQAAAATLTRQSADSIFTSDSTSEVECNRGDGASEESEAARFPADADDEDDEDFEHDDRMSIDEDSDLRDDDEEIHEAPAVSTATATTRPAIRRHPRAHLPGFRTPVRRDLPVARAVFEQARS